MEDATTAPRIQPSADVDDTAYIGPGSVIWHLAQVREGAVLGDDCVVGRGAYIDAGVQIGSRVKIQNHALVYAPAIVGDGAFIGPAAVLTNDRYPRAVTRDGDLRGEGDWTREGVRIGEGASIGARSVVLAGVEVGRWALIAAGAVVTRDVRSHALVVGNPGRQRGWVGHDGVPLVAADGHWRCPATGVRYGETTDGLVARP